MLAYPNFDRASLLLLWWELRFLLGKEAWLGVLDRAVRKMRVLQLIERRTLHP